MKTLNEMRDLDKKYLTIEDAKNLKGKKIQTIYFGYAHQDNTEEFVVGEVMSNLEYYRQLKEECFPNNKGHQNRAEYWESYMSDEQLDRERRTMVLLREDGTSTHMFCDTLLGNIFHCSDADRWVSYIISE